MDPYDERSEEENVDPPIIRPAIAVVNLLEELEEEHVDPPIARPVIEVIDLLEEENVDPPIIRPAIAVVNMLEELEEEHVDAPIVRPVIEVIDLREEEHVDARIVRPIISVYRGDHGETLFREFFALPEPHRYALVFEGFLKVVFDIPQDWNGETLARIFGCCFKHMNHYLANRAYYMGFLENYELLYAQVPSEHERYVAW